MSNPDRIAKVIQNVSRQEVAPDPEESLFDSGYLDSFALTDMVTELEKEFGVSIPDSDLSPRRFETVAKMEAYLESLGK